mgnify:CR=1 FL=1
MCYVCPYPSTVAVRDSINRLQKLFRLRNCVDSFFQNRSRPCLQYQIKRCTGPCVGLVSPADYARDVRHAVMFLEGRSTDVIDELVKSMEQASADLAFERAAELRDEIARLRQMQAKQFVTGNEQDADVVMFIYREELYNKDTDREGLADIIVAKHRNGPTDKVSLHFDKNLTRFSDLDLHTVDEGFSLDDDFGP